MIDEKLATLGINLPVPPQPAAAYVPIVISGKLAFISGQIPIDNGRVIFSGKVTDENLEDGKNLLKYIFPNQKASFQFLEIFFKIFLKRMLFEISQLLKFSFFM